ncbi:MAG: hypothetical protein KDD26_09825 [Winogradskyella sp.]|nr:hypothetical protein [Winogradskyella sp.]
MNPNLLRILALMLSIALVSCSSDDTSSIPDETNNEFTFNGNTYDLMSVIIVDENTANNDPSDISISLFNKTSAEITSNNDLSDISYVNFKIVGTTIQNTTYNQIDSYDVSIDSSITNSEFTPGTVLLSDDDSQSDVYAQSGTVTVTNFTQFNIVFTFTFTRYDGQVISGSYDGNYYMPN